MISWPPPIALYPETDKASLEDGYSKMFIILVKWSRSVVSDSLWLRGL